MGNDITIDNSWLNILKLVEDEDVKLSHIKDEVYAFVNKNNMMKFINLETKTLQDRYYSLLYIDDNIIIGNDITVLLDTKSVIIRISDMQVVYITSKELSIEDDLIYESTARYRQGTDKGICKIFNTECQEIYKLEDVESYNLVELDNTEYFVLYEKMPSSEASITKILHYNRDKDTIEEKFSSREYKVDIIGYGLIMFSNINDFSIIYVYDIINKKSL